MKLIKNFFKIIIAIILISIIATLPQLGIISGVGFLVYKVLDILFVKPERDKTSKKNEEKNNRRAAIDKRDNILDVIYNGNLKKLIDDLKMIKKHNLSLEITDEEGYTPLMYAALFNRTACAKHLIEFGVDINETRSIGRIRENTALDIAIKNNHKHMVKRLRKHGGKRARNL